MSIDSVTAEFFMKYTIRHFKCHFYLFGIIENMLKYTTNIPNGLTKIAGGCRR